MKKYFGRALPEPKQPIAAGKRVFQRLAPEWSWP